MKLVTLYSLLMVVLFLISCKEPDTKNHTASRIDTTPVSISKMILQSPIESDTCNCDTATLKKVVLAKSFNRLEQYDNKSFRAEKFYALDSSVNRTLWFRDIENPGPTKFTAFWDSYAVSNYYANPLDFLSFYKGIKDIPLAFIFGPNSDLWAYHIFVLKKIGCCYVATHSYYRHNRFTYKGYAIADSKLLTELYRSIGATNLQPLDSLNGSYCGYFADNLHNTKYAINFDREKMEVKDSSGNTSSEPKTEITALYDFLNTRFNWKKTYGN